MRLRAPRPLSVLDALAAAFSGVSDAELESLRRDFIAHHELFDALDRRMVEVRHRRALIEDWGEFLYVAIRLERPVVVVETGVFDGISSAVILQALNDNGMGTLVSVDLPAVETIEGSTNYMPETRLPPGMDPGWVVPDGLRARYRLTLGDARECLPRVFEEYPTVDVFFHDSLHTYEHQLYEYTTAWSHLKPRGLLLSDDVTWSAAFDDFCHGQGRAYVRTSYGRFGCVRK